MLHLRFPSYQATVHKSCMRLDLYCKATVLVLITKQDQLIWRWCISYHTFELPQFSQLGDVYSVSICTVLDEDVLQSFAEISLGDSEPRVGVERGAST